MPITSILDYPRLLIYFGRPGRRGVCNWAAKYNMAAFLEFLLLYVGREGKAEASVLQVTALL